MEKREFEKTASIAEAARLLNVQQETIRQWIRAGKIQSFLMGKQLRVRKADIVKMEVMKVEVLDSRHDKIWKWITTHQNEHKQAIRDETEAANWY